MNMDWITLICTTLKLIDIHDSDRAYGNPPNYSKESRTGHKDGKYLDIAFLIIHRLKLLDQSANQDYLPFDTIFDAIKEEWPQTAEVDVQYVLNVLRRPSELYYLIKTTEQQARVLHSEKRETALIEKTDYADEYRLSTSGRLLLSLSNVAHDTTYLRGDAYNLLHAIEFNDFEKILIFSDGIISQLRSEILEVRSALERVGRTENIEKYLNRLDQYKRVIEETISIAKQAETKLEQIDVLVAFEQWQEVKGKDISFEYLRGQINHIRQVLLIFNRLLSELVSLALRSDRSAVPPPSFIKAALQFVRTPLSLENENFLLQQWGPLALNVPFHSVLDGVGAIKLRSISELAQPMSFLNETVDTTSELGRTRFLERYGQKIAEALRNGPLRLSEAIEKGWLLVDNNVMLGNLVGIFVAPSSIPIDGRIMISVNPNLNSRVVDNGEFLFTDVEMTIVEDK